MAGIAKEITMADVYTELRELIAAECHDQWTGWMRYLFNKSDKVNEPDGRIGHRMSADSCERWLRQMMTSYVDLSENEKESDRIEADKIIKLLNDRGYICIPKP